MKRRYVTREVAAQIVAEFRTEMLDVLNRVGACEDLLAEAQAAAGDRGVAAVLDEIRNTASAEIHKCLARVSARLREAEIVLPDSDDA
jgi:hypothetical protein